jgi:hypothetical protein
MLRNLEPHCRDTPELSSDIGQPSVDRTEPINERHTTCTVKRPRRGVLGRSAEAERTRARERRLNSMSHGSPPVVVLSEMVSATKPAPTKMCAIASDRLVSL